MKEMALEDYNVLFPIIPNIRCATSLYKSNIRMYLKVEKLKFHYSPHQLISFYQFLSRHCLHSCNPCVEFSTSFSAVFFVCVTKCNLYDFECKGLIQLKYLCLHSHCSIIAQIDFVFTYYKLYCNEELFLNYLGLTSQNGY